MPTTRLLAIALLALAVLAGCRSTTTQRFDHEYVKPPRYDAAAYATYAVVRTVDGRRQPVAAWLIPGMAPVEDDRAADLVLEMRIDPGRLVDVRETQTVHQQTDGGQHIDHGATGQWLVPYGYALYDGRANTHLAQVESGIRFPESVPTGYASPLAARDALEAEARSHNHAADATDAAREDLRALYRSEMHGGSARITFHLASEAEFEPRIAEAYRILLLRPDAEGAAQAAAIYQSIGFDGVDDDGDPDKHARFAVAYGLAACAFIRGDYEAVPRYGRLARSFGVGGDAQLAELEAAAADQADRYARQPR